MGKREIQKITLFQQNGSGASKIAGMKRFGKNRIEMEIIDIDGPLPDLIDDASPWLPDHIDADLVLDYLTHPDLSEDLSLLCERLGLPLVASGKKVTQGNAMTPAICCMLASHHCLGAYGELFGTPDIDVEVEDGVIKNVEVLRGAPCGATWDAAQKIIGQDVEYARVRYGLEVQFFCTADPASWDPINGKSPVHLAADIHGAAFNRSCKKMKE